MTQSPDPSVHKRLSLRVALQCNRMTVTAGCHKFTIRSNFCAEDTASPDYMQVADEHLTVPAGLINAACCIIEIVINCLNQERKKILVLPITNYITYLPITNYNWCIYVALAFCTLTQKRGRCRCYSNVFPISICFVHKLRKADKVC